MRAWTGFLTVLARRGRIGFEAAGPADFDEALLSAKRRAARDQLGRGGESGSPGVRLPRDDVEIGTSTFDRGPAEEPDW